MFICNYGFTVNRNLLRLSQLSNAWEIEGGENMVDRFTILRVPSMIAKYFMNYHGDLTELSQGLLNDSLKSIIQQEAKENGDARKILARL